MSEQIFMDVPAVRGLASRFGQMGETMQNLSKALEMAINALKAAAFVSAFATAAYATYLEQIKPIIDQFAERCTQMSSDLEASATAYANGDAAGATKFH